ncbi:MAG: hypothetical protein ACP5NP_00310 [Acetobacteraceae bacterium]
MADQADVETALVGLANTALYPNGPGTTSVPGPDCRIYRGWPNAAALDADLRAGKVNVTIYPAPGMGRVSTRYVQEWLGVPAAPVLTVSVTGNTVSFGGSASLGQVAGVAVDGATYAYRVQPGDNPALVAANLAVLIRPDRPAQVTGSTLTLPGAGVVLARVTADAPAQQEARRQTQVFRITCWCPTPAVRDATAGAIDLAMAQIQFISLPDGTEGRLIYGGTAVFDQSQDALLYRRDLLYSIEYATILSATQATMLFGALGVNSGQFVA